MEQLTLPPSNGVQQDSKAANPGPFIVSNTEEIHLQDLKNNHIIPVYVKDNEPLISHYDFIDATWEVAHSVYGDASTPVVRMSHPNLGRIPDARNKPASDLQEHEKTLYYERMMFAIQIPVNYDVVDGNHLTLTVGGVKVYNLDNLHNKKGSPEHFKVFVGFKNMVCCNMCVTSDGLLADMQVTNHIDLYNRIYELLCNYNAMEHLKQMQHLPQYSLSERQFATLIGKSRMYQYLPNQMKKDIPQLLFGDSQINSVCKDYYRDQSFCKGEDGSINLWKLYNLFTGSNKSSYIDGFLPRAANATDFVNELVDALENKGSNWFLM